jgi:hypothetical protein
MIRKIAPSWMNQAERNDRRTALEDESRAIEPRCSEIAAGPG